MQIPDTTTNLEPLAHTNNRPTLILIVRVQSPQNHSKLSYLSSPDFCGPIAGGGILIPFGCGFPTLTGRSPLPLPNCTLVPGCAANAGLIVLLAVGGGGIDQPFVFGVLRVVEREVCHDEGGS